MTLARQLTTDSTSRLLAAAARAEPDALLLGSVLPDLPYHGRFGWQLARHFTGQDYLQSEWGDVFHTRSTGQLALGLLRHFGRSHLPAAEGRRVLALVAGYLSHHAVDRVVHPVINRLVEREQSQPRSNTHRLLEPPTRIHERIERYQSLFYHRDLLGHELPCSRYPRQIVTRMAGAGLVRPGIDPVLGRAIRAACLETHGRAPADDELRDWLWGTTAYGALFSSPLALLERPRGADRLRIEYFRGPEVDLLSPLQQAQEATGEQWDAADQLLRADRITTEVREVFLHRVPDVDLGTGA